MTDPDRDPVAASSVDVEGLLARLHAFSADLATEATGTGAYGNGYRAAREFDLTRLRSILAATGVTCDTQPRARAHDPFVREATCTNYLEDQDRPCTGTLRFHLGDPQAACDMCSAWCGWLVADYRPYSRTPQRS